MCWGETQPQCLIPTISRSLLWGEAIKFKSKQFKKMLKFLKYSFSF